MKNKYKYTENLFTKKIEGDTLLQLKNGNLLFYYIRSKYTISVYNEKTFQKIVSFDINKLINKNANFDDKPKESEDSNDEKDLRNKILKTILLKSKRRYLNEYTADNKRKNCIKELSNGVILIGRDNYLIELKLKGKEYESKVVNILNTIILDVNELSDKRILVISYDDIIVFNKENDEYIKEQEYPIKNKWKIVPMSSIERFYGSFHQYYSSEILPNDRLLLKSYSTELCYNHGCGTNPPYEISHSKIIFIDTKNFEEIKSTQLFKYHAKYAVLDNIVVIQDNINLVTYNINTLELIRNYEIKDFYKYMYQYDKQYLFTISGDERYNRLYIYKVENDNVAEYKMLDTEISYEKRHGWGSPISRYNNKFLLTLKDKRVIIFCQNRIYVLRLNLE